MPLRNRSYLRTARHPSTIPVHSKTKWDKINHRLWPLPQDLTWVRTKLLLPGRIRRASGWRPAVIFRDPERAVEVPLDAGLCATRFLRLDRATRLERGSLARENPAYPRSVRANLDRERG